MNEVLWTAPSRLLEDIYQATPHTFDPSHWKSISEVGIHTGDIFKENSTDQKVKEAIICKETIMFVPTPEKETSYRVFKFDGENPSIALDTMQVIAEWVPFEQTKEILTRNLTRKWRDIIVLFPHPKNKTVDLFVIEKWEPKRCVNTIASTQKQVWNIVSSKAV